MTFTLTKSDHTRTVELYRAYETIKKYRDELVRLHRIDIMMDVTYKMRIKNEVIRISQWLHEKEKELMVVFDIETN